MRGLPAEQRQRRRRALLHLRRELGLERPHRRGTRLHPVPCRRHERWRRGHELRLQRRVGALQQRHKHLLHAAEPVLVHYAVSDKHAHAFDDGKYPSRRQTPAFRLPPTAIPL